MPRNTWMRSNPCFCPFSIYYNNEQDNHTSLEPNNQPDSSTLSIYFIIPLPSVITANITSFQEQSEIGMIYLIKSNTLPLFKSKLQTRLVHS